MAGPAMADSATIPAPMVRRLGNGLRVVLDPRPDCGRVAVCVHYGVGFRSERPGEAGLAHLFEHLMFRGSAALPGGRFFDHVHALGGEANGTTHQDYTDYYQVVAAAGLRRALFAEADRMRAPLFTPAAVSEQIEGVRQEITAALHGRPFGGLPWPALPAVLFDDFAHGHDGYGDPDDLAAVTPERCRAFFARHYRPGNAVLTVSGGFDPAQADRWIEDDFGDIPAGPVPPRPAPPSPAASGGRRVLGTEPRTSARVTVVGVPVDGYDRDPDGYLARWVLTRLLDPTGAASGAGRGPGHGPGRWDVGLGYFGPLDAVGHDVLVATCVSSAAAPDRAHADLLGALDRLADGDRRRSAAAVSDRAGELAREQSHQLDEIVGRARLLGRAELLLGGAGVLTDVPDRIAAVSAAAVADAAADLRVRATLDGGHAVAGIVTVIPGRVRTRPRLPVDGDAAAPAPTAPVPGAATGGPVHPPRPVHPAPTPRPVPVLAEGPVDTAPLPLRVLARRHGPDGTSALWIDRQGGPVVLRARWSLTLAGRRDPAAVGRLLDRVRAAGPRDAAVAWSVGSDGQSVTVGLQSRVTDLPGALIGVGNVVRTLLDPRVDGAGRRTPAAGAGDAPTTIGRGARRPDPRTATTDFAAADRAYGAAVDAAELETDADADVDLHPALVVTAGGSVVICGPAVPGGPDPDAAVQRLSTALAPARPASSTSGPDPRCRSVAPVPLVLSGEPRPGFHELAVITEDPVAAMHDPARYLATAALGGHPGSRLARATVRPGEPAARVFAGYDRVAGRWRSVLRATVPWSASADPTAPMEQMLALLREVTDGWRTDPPGPDEMDRTRRYCAAQVPAATDSAEAVAELLVHVLATGGDVDQLMTFPQRLWREDPAAVRWAGDRLFGRPADTLVVVGASADQAGAFAAAAARNGFSRTAGPTHATATAGTVAVAGSAGAL